MTDKVEKLAARMLGTCDGYVDELNELTLEECYELDSIVLCCESCGWWWDAWDVIEDGLGFYTCPDCRSDPGV